MTYETRAYIRLKLHLDHFLRSHRKTLSPAGHPPMPLDIGWSRVQSFGVSEAAEWSWPFF